MREAPESVTATKARMVVAALYVAALLLPGGSLLAIALWLYRRRQIAAASRPRSAFFGRMPAVISSFDVGIDLRAMPRY